MLLHTVNKSPFERNALQSCLQHVKRGSAVLLIEDGVYGALAGTEYSRQVEQALATVEVYVLQPDVEARGLQNRLLAGVRPVDYSGFVDLVVNHTSVQSWL